MGHPASFYHLFRQSNYSRDIEGKGLTMQNREEKFAVAALAFALEHNHEFKSFFLKVICDARISDHDLPNYAIKCQDGHYCDLRIEKTGAQIFVIEVKVRANLEHRQNPLHRDFKTGQGYGCQILEKHKLCGKKHYIILRNQPLDLSSADSTKISLVSRTWGDLLRYSEKHPDDSLINDLIDSLGQFGIPALKMKELGRLQKANSAEHAVDIHLILASVADKLRIKRKWDFNSNPDVSYIGIDLPAQGATRPRLPARLREKNAIGWFGYDRLNTKWRRSIWIYHTANQDGRNEKRLRTETISKLAKVDRIEGHFVLTPKSAVTGDGTWFFEVLSGYLRA